MAHEGTSLIVCVGSGSFGTAVLHKDVLRKNADTEHDYRMANCQVSDKKLYHIHHDISKLEATVIRFINLSLLLILMIIYMDKFHS